MHSENKETCSKCYLCCTTASIPPFAEMEYDARPELRDYGFPSLDAEPFNKERLAKKPCVWLENGGCKHYEDRPDMCQHFQFGGFECNVIRERKGYYRINVSEPSP